MRECSQLRLKYVLKKARLVAFRDGIKMGQVEVAHKNGLRKAELWRGKWSAT